MNIVYIDYVIVFVMLPAIGVAVSMSSWISKAVSFERELYDWISPDLYIVPLVLASFVCVLVSAGTLYEIIVTTSAGTKSSAESKVGRLLLCFSAYTNTKKVFDTRQLPGQLPFLDGLRVLSALWIILGHMDFYGNVIASIGNRSEHDVRDQEWWFFIIEPYDLAVDTFLVLGGFLVSHVFLKQLKKRDGHFTGKDLALNYLHRYCRLTPVYLATLLIYLPFDKGCRSYWWTNLLYINNYFMEPEQQCTGSSWYLGVDMQLYIIAPALILLLYRKPKYGISINVFLVVLSWACNLEPLNTVGIQLGCVNPFFWTPARMGPYVIGILLAYLLFRISSKIPNTLWTKVWMLVGWAINAALVGILVWAPSVFRAFNPEGSTWMVRTTVERLLWSAAICWVIYACSVGYGGIISEFLSWKLWQPLSRLSYVAYLIHPLILYSFWGHYRGHIFYSGGTWFILFVGLSVSSFVGAFVMSVGVEIPSSELEKHILPSRHGRKLENGKIKNP